MTDLTSLEEEIKSLEEGIFNNPEAEKPEAIEAQEGVVVEGQLEGIEALEPSPEDTFTESVVETITEESTETDQTETKPTRTNWKKKYQGLDKRFRNLKAANDSTIFELRSELSLALSETGKLSTRVDVLSEKLSKVQGDKDVYAGMFSEEEQDIIGKETLDSLKKMNDAAIQSAVAPLKEQLAEEQSLRQEANQEAVSVQNKAVASNFLSRLGDLVEDYEDFDVDPEFHQWMGEADALSGMVRKTIFKKAQEIGDVGRVAQFFLEFKKIKNAGAEKLEELITPSTSSSNTAARKQATPTKRYISMAKIAQFIEDVGKGRYRGKEKLVKEMEAQIDSAQREGRIVA